MTSLESVSKEDCDVTEAMDADAHSASPIERATDTPHPKSISSSYPNEEAEPVEARNAPPDPLYGRGSDQLKGCSEPAQADCGAGSDREERREVTVLILGKTGNGKSSLANTLVGRKAFAVGRGMFSTTLTVQAVTADVMGKRLKVIDTPDITSLTSDSTTTARQHVTQWKQLTHPAPDVIMLAVRCDVRYTKEEHAIFRQVQELWGDNSVFQGRLMVAFTFGDLHDGEVGEELEGVCEELQAVLKQAAGRYVQVNNRARGEQDRARQLQHICQVMDSVLAHNEKPAPALAQPQEKPFALVVIGHTGHGKSSVANLLTGGHSFGVSTGPFTVTTQVAAIEMRVAGTRFKVIDTPDLKRLDPRGKQEQIQQWKKMTSDHTVVFLVVVRCDVRYTSEELAVYQEVQDYWSRELPYVNYQVVVVFTFTDRMDYRLDENVRKCPELLRLLAGAGDARIMVDSRPPEARRSAQEHAAERQKALGMLLSHLRKPELTPAGVLVSKVKKIPAAVSERVGRLVHYMTEFDDVELGDTTDHRDTAVTCHFPANQKSTEDNWCAIV